MTDEIRLVKKDRIKIPEIRVSSEMDDKIRRAFNLSIDRMGTIQYPIVREIEGGELELIDGRNRLEEDKKEDIEVIVKVATDEQALLFNLIQGVARGKPNRRDMLNVIERLMQTHGTNDKVLSELTGIDYDRIRYLKRPLGWSPRIRDALLDGKISYNVARAVAESKQEDKIKSKVEQDLLTGLYGEPVDVPVEKIRAALETREYFQARTQARAAAKKTGAVVKDSCSLCQKEAPPTQKQRQEGWKYKLVCPDHEDTTDN